MGSLIRWEGATDVGFIRQRNEDAWGGAPLGAGGPGAVLVIADGMGGLPGGDVASRLAVETVLDHVSGFDEGAHPSVFLGTLFEKARGALARRAEADRTLERMGTTLTIVLVREDGAWVGHLGDCRLLWGRGNETCLVTADHNLAWNLVDAGLLSPDAAEQDPSSSILTRHVGPTATLRPDIAERPLDLRSGDRLLLASDGLGKVVRMEEVAGILSREVLPAAVRELIRRTRDGGAPDNVTVLLAEVVDPFRPSGPTLGWDEPRHRWVAPG